jgi:phosphatidylglycerophosphate synthase
MEITLIWLTVARLGLGVGFCAAVIEHSSPLVAISWLITIIAADIADGVVARQFHVDSTRRRVIDAVVDRITIHVAAAIVVWEYPLVFLLVTPVIIRDFVLIFRNWWLLRHKRIIIGPGNIHRFGTVLYAILCATVLITTGPVAIGVSIGVNLIVWVLLVDYLQAGKLARANTTRATLVRYAATGLRGLRGLPPIQVTEER